MTALPWRVAAVLLRLPPRPESRWCQRAMDSLVRAAGTGARPAGRALARARSAHGLAVVWRSWLRPSVSGPAPRRWVDPPFTTHLLDAAEPVPQQVVDAAWRDWLAQHHPGLWSLLEDWGTAAAEAEPEHALSRLALGELGVAVEPAVLSAAAGRFHHPIGERARARLLSGDCSTSIDLFCAAAVGSPEAVAFCVAHHLAPADEVERATFFLRTGQYDQHQALDPEGALLALGYRAASVQVRTDLRTAMTGRGDLDVLKVLAGQRDRAADFAALPEGEQVYVARQLARRGEWDRLWPLTVLLPLAEAVETAGAFGDWRPADDEGRAVLAALRAADPRVMLEDLAVLNATPARLEPEHIDLLNLINGRIDLHDLDFAPDAPQLAFCGAGLAGVLDLNTRTLTQLHRKWSVLEVAHLGAGTIAFIENFESTFSVHLAGPEGARSFHVSDASHVRRIAGERSYMLVGHRLFQPKYQLYTAGSDQPLPDNGPLSELEQDFPRVIAMDVDRRRLALFGKKGYGAVDLVDGTVNRLTGQPASGKNKPLHAAMSPRDLVCVSSLGELWAWPDPLSTDQPCQVLSVWSKPPFSLVWSAALNRFLTVSRSHIELLDIAATQHTTGEPRPVVHRADIAAVRRRFKQLATCSPDGDLLAVTGERPGVIDLYDLSPLAVCLTSSLTRPMGLMDHTDLEKVTTALGSAVFDGAARRTLTLLRTCLEYRFRHDVGIGRGMGVLTSPDDIALGRPAS